MAASARRADCRETGSNGSNESGAVVSNYEADGKKAAQSRHSKDERMMISKRYECLANLNMLAGSGD
ncbi:hypothetical protein ASE07_11655 [Noviherbaspirillum sp. Root189]|nr:hypothetical protein ASE07_11655 [Noviherbaspirillum sp. Root189]